MIRTPLRPLAQILKARDAGQNPDAIERENIRLRHEEMRDQARQRAEGRLLVMGVFFTLAFCVIGARMGIMTQSEPVEPRAGVAGVEILAQRADIVDRYGRILATNFETHSLYAQPQQMVEPERAAKELVALFPDLDEKRLLKDFTGSRKFLWVKKKLSPEQVQAVHDIGEPGLLFGPREMRLYPNGRLAAHVMGGASFGREGVHAAEVIGVAGVEKYFDDRLRDPAQGHEPLTLSLDLSVQSALERVLQGGMMLMNAKGAAAVLMKVETGEVLAVASLPDFDPNDRPRPPTEGNPEDSPLFNRAVQGVYELGSVFKSFTVAQALDLRLVNPSTIIDTKGPLRWGKHKIRDFRNYGPELSVTEVIVKSSNIGTARIAQMIGAKRQQDFLKSLGLFEATPIEIVEAKGGEPLLPPKWSELSTMTVAYGHGMSTSPMHLAAGYATLANGGYLVKPTLLKQPRNQRGPQVMSKAAADRTLKMLREVVGGGTASFGEVPGYEVAGKTGTADKPKPNGGYYDEKVLATFASVFPASKPEYVLVVTLDEPVETSGDEPRRTAGWTAVPVAAEIIRRVAPLLGLRPEFEPAALDGITLTSGETQ
ncbi:peptidoglycan D,D-transpeptidase FtsI family protein [Roseovarius rhodophyticola]|uniref:Penicillin-binding protein 2 n=1 Tax=Roseovarius rhodophyticola TaxID=3080827 RepID=A0ABZ2TD83_9RHOB|nr:penicillin-binding protein 2 [Roseovarius sp. W115]MDV2931380.1 penicillin-binding protein 2 [Roseovarius sp. W115]